MVTDSAAAEAIVRCAFYIRRVRPAGHAVYESIHVASYFHDGNLATLNPPLPGDQMLLWDEADGKWVSYRVLERQWRPIEYGSQAWPPNQQIPPGGDHLDITVEVCEGLFSDEADGDEPEIVSAMSQPPGGVQVSARRQIGVGGNGLDRTIPECPVCYARGGGGHGGFCPNSGDNTRFWVSAPPAGYSRPPRPEGRQPW